MRIDNPRALKFIIKLGQRLHNCGCPKFRCGIIPLQHNTSSHLAIDTSQMPFEAHLFMRMTSP